MTKHLILLFFLMTSAGLLTARTTKVHADRLWTDVEGKPMNAHGGNILFHDGVYYLYGEHRIENTPGVSQDGIYCYSSTDLVNWTSRGYVLRPTGEADFEMGCLMERPKVVYNKRTKKFVMLFHLELKGKGYAAARVGFAVSDAPDGRFRFVRSLRPNAKHWPKGFKAKEKELALSWRGKDLSKLGHEQWKQAVETGVYLARDYDGGQMSRDMTVYVDDNGKAYHIFSSEENATLHIARLTKDYLDYTGEYVRVAPGGSNEAPCIFKKNGVYWLITSGCTGWAPNKARMFSARNIFGPWKQHETPFTGPGCETTFSGQGAYILDNRKRGGGLYFVGDIWQPKQLSRSRQLWLPIDFEDGKPSIPWRETWELELPD
ncbi:MAG TPA: beta-glucanase [Prevotellaceae bacterium]|nr:beta-glucanase [Prevotellaceae bacterium]